MVSLWFNKNWNSYILQAFLKTVYFVDLFAFLITVVVFFSFLIILMRLGVRSH